MIKRKLNLVTHTMLMVAVMVYPTMVPHRFTYCAMPHMNTSLGPASHASNFRQVFLFS
jgi:hypothetical protein